MSDNEKPELNEQELLEMGLGIVPAIDTFNQNPFPVGTIKFVDDQELVYKHEHVLHWFETIVLSRTLNLSPEDKDRYFQMVTDYADILIKISGDDNHVIFKAALGKPFEDLENHAKNSGMKIDYDKPKKLLDEYYAWKEKQPKSKKKK
jgi:hypothetical protein